MRNINIFFCIYIMLAVLILIFILLVVLFLLGLKDEAYGAAEALTKYVDYIAEEFNLSDATKESGKGFDVFESDNQLVYTFSQEHRGEYQHRRDDRQQRQRRGGYDTQLFYEGLALKGVYPINHDKNHIMIFNKVRGGEGLKHYVLQHGGEKGAKFDGVIKKNTLMDIDAPEKEIISLYNFVKTKCPNICRHISQEDFAKPFIKIVDNICITYMSPLEKIDGVDTYYVLDIWEADAISHAAAQFYYNYMGFEYKDKAIPDGLVDTGYYFLYKDTGKWYHNFYISVYSSHPEAKHDFGVAALWSTKPEMLKMLFAYIKGTGEFSDVELKAFVRYVKQMRADIFIRAYVASSVTIKEAKEYGGKATRHAESIKRILDNALVEYTLKNYLDIGAIDTKQLDAAKDILGLENSYGINIDEGVGHLNYDYEVDKSRIIYYDGKNIPVIEGIDKYDLITIFNTIHHIPPESISEMLTSLRKRCNGYVVVKDNSLYDESVRMMFDWQHLIYERDIYLRAYTRYDLTMDSIRQMFEAAGFEQIYNTEPNTFTGIFFAVFK